MSKPLKPRRGTTAEHASFIGEAYEVTYDTDKHTLVMHDGLTAGGFPLARADEVAAKDAEQDAAISAAQSSADEKVATVNGLTPDSNGNVDVGGMPLGSVFPYTGKDVPAGTLRADGSTYTNMRSSFPEFYEWVVNSGLTVPLGDYALVEGSCGFYGLDTSTGTVRMPTLAAGVFGTVEAGKYGQAIQAGLPNITGETGLRIKTTVNSPEFKSGALMQTAAEPAGNAGGTTEKTKTQIKFDASWSNPIYGNSNTVTPSHVKYPWVIVVYNAAVSPSVAQAGEFIEMLDGKADKDTPKDSAGKNLVRSVNGVDADEAGDVKNPWVFAYQQLFTSTAIGDYTLSLDSYLPNDGASYEVLVKLWADRGGDTSNTNTNLRVYLEGQSVGWMQLTVDGANFQQGNESAIVPIGTSRKLNVAIDGYKLNRSFIEIYGYRRY